MSIFRANGVVLQVIKLNEKELFYKILFREYGILKVKKKKKLREKPVDTGYIISSEIVTQHGRDIHTIGNIKILNFFQTENTSYSQIEGFLKIIGIILRELPVGSPHYEIYDIISHYIKNSSHITEQKNLLSQLKVISCLGDLTDSHPNPTTQKILKFIHSSPYKDILRLGIIQKETIDFLKKNL